MHSQKVGLRMCALRGEVRFMWLIPGKTNIKTEIFKGFGFIDLIFAAVGIGLVTLVVLSTLPYHYIIAVVVAAIFVFMILKVNDESNYQYMMHILKFLVYEKDYRKAGGSKSIKAKANSVARIMPFTDIADGLINYNNEYYGAVLEIPAVKFRFFSEARKHNSIVNGLGRVLRSLNPDYAANIVKLDRPIHYEAYLDMEYEKLDALRSSFESGDMREDELQARVEIIYDRIKDLEHLVDDAKIYGNNFYLVLFDADAHQLEVHINDAWNTLTSAELPVSRLDDRELAMFLKYTNDTAVDETEVDNLDPSEYAAWAMPDSVFFRSNSVHVNRTVTSIKRVQSYPQTVSNAWLATVLSMPGTKVVIKVTPMDRLKAVRTIDRSLQELRSQYIETNVDSRMLELQQHIQSLSELLETLQGENECLLSTNIYVTNYDIVNTERIYKDTPERQDLPRINDFSKTLRRLYRENGMRLNTMEFQQLKCFIGAQVSGYDPFAKEGRGIPSNTISAAYPWVFFNIRDEKGVKLGYDDGMPVFVDFFRRDNERVNSNMVIVGKSGSGKSYATKSILANLAADNSKIFILDPENEYTELAMNLHGKVINVGNAQYGRMNPFHIITALDDEENEGGVTGSYATHLQFLEEFFRQVLPDCEKDALEYLNSLIDRMYMNKGITPDTDLSLLNAEDYPIFDDLYDTILQEFQESDNEYIHTMLRTLMNYIQKFSTGGRNANIWNGPSSITTDENFTVFDFQSLLSNRNSTIANAQMLMVLKYIDNEIIKNRDYNMRNHANRKIVVVVDEAHVFIDEKYPIALDFMFQLAKRIRKYNGMQIVITQNIKDFVGTEEIARKSTAIINACQYSYIFSLAPNDMDDLCKLYEKAGGINENEQEMIVSAQRGQTFAVLSPSSRATFHVDVPVGVVDMFEQRDFQSKYFTGFGGDENWEDFVGGSRAKYEEAAVQKHTQEMEDELQRSIKSFVSFEILDNDEELKKLAQQEQAEKDLKQAEKEDKKKQDDTDDSESSGSGAAIAPAAIDYAAIAAAVAASMHRDSEQEERLTQLVERLSDENISLKMEERINQAVRERVAEYLSAVTAANPASYAGQSAYAADDSDEEMPMASPEPPSIGGSSGMGATLGNIFDMARDDDAYKSSDSGRSGSMGLDDDDDDDELFGLGDDSNEEDDDDLFDFIKMFSDQAKTMNEMNISEQMDLYDDATAEMSLEDLKKYVTGQK